MTIEEKVNKECASYWSGKELAFSVMEKSKVIDLIQEACNKLRDNIQFEVASKGIINEDIDDAIYEAFEPTWEK